MYIRKLPYIIFRAYSQNGYLTDNRNLGYDTASKSCLKVGDLLLSKEGSIFYSLLEDSFQSVYEITNKLTRIFDEVSYDTLLNDAKTFYVELANKGFVLCKDKLSNETKPPCYFSYANYTPFLLDITDEDINYNVSFAKKYSLSRIHIDISSLCNENCIHCYVPAANKCGLMSQEVFDKVITQCISMKVLNITLSGGEPMLNPSLKSFITKCSKENFSINILSNLTCLSDELLDIIEANPLISIQTSLYALNEDIHDSITRRKGSYHKTTSAIKRLHERNVPMQINCPIMKQNVTDYRDVLNFAASLNIEASADYGLFGCYDSSGSNIGCRISPVQIDEILKTDYDNENTYQESVREIESKKVHNDDPICSVCKSSLCVANNGDVYPCEGWQKMVLGNVNQKSLRYIWEKLPLTKQLRNLKYRDFAKCSVCQDRKYCTTCLIMNANDCNNDYMKVNSYMCEMAAIKKSVIETHKNSTFHAHD